MSILTNWGYKEWSLQEDEQWHPTAEAEHCDGEAIRVCAQGEVGRRSKGLLHGLSVCCVAQGIRVVWIIYC
jgi:hypothetical protein